MKIRQRQSNRLAFESLEPRAMLAADPGWAFTLGGPSALTDSAVNIGPDDRVYVAGGFEGTVDFDPGPGTAQLTAPIGAQDGFVAKYTKQGSLVWVTRFGGSDGLEEPSALEFDAAGNVYVMGSLSSTAPSFGSTTLESNGSWDVFATKVEANTGNFLWARNIGGPNVDAGPAGIISPSGDVYMTGFFRNTVDFDPSSDSAFYLTAAGGADEADQFIWKLDANGDFAWARSFGGPSLETGQRLALGGDGYMYALGTFRGAVDFGNPGEPLILSSHTPDLPNTSFIKLDEITGSTLWAKGINGVGEVTNAKIAADGAGGLFVAGRFNETVNFGAGAPTLVSQGSNDGYLSKWDTSGNFQWANQFADGPGGITIDTMRLDADGNLLFTVAFDGTADFDPGLEQVILNSDLPGDGAILKLNADGSFAWVRQVSGTGLTQGRGIAVDDAGNVYVHGYFQRDVTLPTGHVLTGGGRGNYLMKLAFGDAPTKFYVVDDASANRTFEYDSAGATGGNNSLNSGNTAPRGAASTAAGDCVWVVDANRKVFVYDINGNLFGSWSAGSMPFNATPEGITTNGTDVWIVDSKSDKVFKYTGAASRVSGSQNASSSFNLNSGNANPKDIVTNGASLWIVNDASTDKVFKYSVAGSMQGSWAISSANSQPTGLTIDPSNVSDIWIVDSGTDRVYQYAGAVSRTSGSQAAAASFALGSGNSNPQGIADPPPLRGQSNPSAAQSLDSSNLMQAAPLHTAIAKRSTDTSAKTASRSLAREQILASMAIRQTYLPQFAKRRDADCDGWHDLDHGQPGRDDISTLDAIFETELAGIL